MAIDRSRAREFRAALASCAWALLSACAAPATPPPAGPPKTTATSKPATPAAVGRKWKPGASPCLGFKADGSAAFVLLHSDTGDNLEIASDYTVAKIDFASKKSSSALAVAHESDCQSRCDENPSVKTGEGEPNERAKRVLAAAASKLSALIAREQLRACRQAKAAETDGDEQRFALDGGAELRVVPKGKPGGEQDKAARDVGVVVGKGALQRAFTLAAEAGGVSRSVGAVYYAPGVARAVVVISTEEDGTSETAHAVVFKR